MSTPNPLIDRIRILQEAANDYSGESRLLEDDGEKRAAMAALTVYDHALSMAVRELERLDRENSPEPKPEPPF